MRHPFEEMHDKDYTIIPADWCPTKFYTITLEGVGKLTLDINDTSFMHGCELCGCIANALIRYFKETHALGPPQLCLKPDGTFMVKIATMEKEFYEELMERNKCQENT